MYTVYTTFNNQVKYLNRNYVQVITKQETTKQESENPADFRSLVLLPILEKVLFSSILQLLALWLRIA